MMGFAVPDNMTQETTVRRAAEGDEIAFARLVAAHHASMARVAFVIVGDTTVASDAVQAAWEIAWRRLRDLRDPDQVHAWLVAIAANEARGAIRRGRRRPVVDLSNSLDRLGDGDPAEGIDLVDLERALRRLKPEDRGLDRPLAMSRASIPRRSPRSSGVPPRACAHAFARLLDRLRTDLEHD